MASISIAKVRIPARRRERVFGIERGCEGVCVPCPDPLEPELGRPEFLAVISAETDCRGHANKLPEVLWYVEENTKDGVKRMCNVLQYRSSA